ncbi:MAG: cytochrome C oxidase subunit III [Candidatus Rokuibacteriota bacterium]|nr:MAG: cytochrome C oxidase subunit III [Candidatus Rokubacteria bacterium]
MRRPVLDVSALPPIAYGSRTTIWWGVLGLIAIEGAALALTAVAALYLRQNFMTWPPYGTPPPGLAAATANVVLLALSVWPMYVADRAAQRERRLPVIIALGIACVFNVATLALRGFEFAALNCWWDDHAYGSAVWLLLGMHAAHLVASAIENVLLLALVVKGPLERKHFVDVHVNALYWYFIVAVWVPVYVLVFLAPRWS